MASISMDEGKEKSLTFNDNTADAPTQSDATLQSDGYAGPPNRTADPMKTDEY